MSQLLVSFTSDTEDNHPTYVPGWHKIGSNYDVKPSIIKWEWTRHLRHLTELFKSKDVPVTWLVRVDDGPMRNRMLDLFGKEILELKSSGDEVGIHIHTFVWNQVLSRWVQTKDSKLEAEIVLRSLDMFQGKLGFRPSSVRMGWNTMSNEIIRTLDANDLLVDSSAIPGTFCPGKFGKRDNIYDWSRAPHAPYHPSHDDYQSSGNLKILEIPISTLGAEKSKISADLVNRLSGVRGLVRLVPLAKRLGLNPHHSFYISPWWSSSIYNKIIKAYRKKALANGKAFLVASFHACDILDPKTGNKNIIFKQYLSRIIEQLSSPGRIEVRFITLSEMARNYDMGKITEQCCR